MHLKMLLEQPFLVRKKLHLTGLGDDSLAAVLQLTPNLMKFCCVPAYCQGCLLQTGFVFFLKNVIYHFILFITE